MAPRRKPAAGARRLAEGLQQAIRAEVEGQHFYLMAAQSTRDAKGQEIFRRLAEEELAHQRFLMAQFESVQKTGQPNPALSLGRPAELAGADPIFSAELRGRLREAHFEMTALSVGIQLEINAERFYRAEAKAAGDRTVKAFFNRLAEWESGHYHALLRQQEALQQDYWTVGGFAPF